MKAICVSLRANVYTRTAEVCRWWRWSWQVATKQNTHDRPRFSPVYGK